MTAQLLFEYRDNCWECALLKDGQLYAYRKEHSGIAAEQIYLSKADRIIRGTEAVFVKLTDKENGYLPYSEIKGIISVPPRSGEKLLLQVKKPPVQQKCAYMTCDITLAGKYVILLPFGNRISVSSHIDSENDISRLKALAANIRPSGMGLIMREEASSCQENDIRAELQELLERWQHIQKSAAAATAPALIDSGLTPVEKMLRDTKCTVCEIVTNVPDSFDGISVPVRSAPHPMMLYNIQGKLEKSLRRKIWLDCGGNLIVDVCEALTVFDVNSAKDLGSKKGAQDTIVRLNVEAAKEIARLLRLRSIGGIVLIDFVDMQKEEDRKTVIAALEEALKDDPVKTIIHGFTALGLLEISRKKTSDPLTSAPETPCPHCKGTGILENKHE